MRILLFDPRGCMYRLQNGSSRVYQANGTLDVALLQNAHDHKPDRFFLSARAQKVFSSAQRKRSSERMLLFSIISPYTAFEMILDIIMCPKKKLSVYFGS